MDSLNINDAYKLTKRRHMKRGYFKANEQSGSIELVWNYDQELSIVDIIAERSKQTGPMGH